jgi:serine/threonine protein kinase
VLESDHNYYIVQELCECDLKSWMKRDGKYSAEVAVGLLEQICLGFHEVIKHGVIHRDVKPENILIKNKVLKLADFGFAKSVAADSMNQSLVGTPYYMAPQILRR